MKVAAVMVVVVVVVVVVVMAAGAAAIWAAVVVNISAVAGTLEACPVAAAISAPNIVAAARPAVWGIKAAARRTRML
jgi:hypothetical protein